MFWSGLLTLIFSVTPIANENGVAVLDTFGQESLSAWRDTSDGNMPTEKVTKGWKVSSTFVKKPSVLRVSIDRQVDWNLESWNRFELDVEVENVEAFGASSLYFHSGDGWYSCGGFTPVKEGTIVFEKKDFRSEGKPAGWDCIDRVRISFWKGGESDGAITFCQFRAVQKPILFLTTRNAEGVEFWRARRNAAILSGTLQDVGILADTQCLEKDQSEEDWEKVLQPRKMLVVAYAPYMPAEMREFLKKYGEKHGKPVLFIEKDLEKEKLEVTSFLEWIGSHPPLKKQIVEQMVANLGVVGGVTPPRISEIQTEVREVFEKECFSAGLQNCLKKQRELLREIALRTRESDTLKFRAWWNHDGQGAYKGDWPRTARELKAAGFTAVFPNLLWAACAAYPSDLIPQGKRYGEEDLLKACVEACHAEGLEVHVWKVNFNMQYDLTPELREKYRQEGRLQKNQEGEEFPWLCPSHPANFELEWKSMVEMAVRYPIDGVHFDYIRYPGRETCYCEGCRERFEKAIGKTVANWPLDVIRGEEVKRFESWRCDQITAIVRKTREELKKVRPETKVSAAVFNSYPNCRSSVGQDWVLWAKEGYVDFLCPMNYTQDTRTFQRMTARQQTLVGKDFPLYPGIGEWRLTPDGVVEQIREADSLDCPGFIIFNLTEMAAGKILPLLTP
ncbi:MAG: family 10 glycosylhydrolase [Planctomycetia bacterium]|nr:family 10 glycosylhydrolase [Planctomycetia bacterium]